jgi:tRNA (cytosine38-C5)-methyltransferase
MKYLEFYSGIGGHRCALNELVKRSSAPTSFLSSSSSSSTATTSTTSTTTTTTDYCRCCPCLHDPSSPVVCLGAFDVSTSANDTYHLNFPTPHNPSQKPIEKLTVEELDAFNADLWLMSPPCQPYTRQRANEPTAKKDINDRRAASFTHLTRALPRMEHPPRFILLENVVGFESSESCQQWLDVLSLCKYNILQFHLSPVQFGIPNSRPRYYCIAQKHANTVLSQASSNTQSSVSTSGIAAANTTSTSATIPLHTSLDSFVPQEMTTSCQCWPDQTFAAPALSKRLPLSAFLEHQGQVHTDVSSALVSLPMLSRSFSDCVDLVTPLSTTSCCFTKSYGSYLKGTGSLVVMEKEPGDSLSLLGGSSNTIEEMKTVRDREASDRPTKRSKTEVKLVKEPSEAWHVKFGNDRLRYFTPTEIARLLGFPSSHTFHESVSLKKKYALLGNSLHVGTVARLLHILLSSPD